MRFMKRLALALAPSLLAASPALAHLRPEEHGSLAAGFSHPLFGADHVLAMVSVGLWAAVLGGRALWTLPSAFVAAMCAGFLLSLAGLTLPFVEPAILASVIVLGVLVAMTVRLPLGAGTALVGVFALFHGYAHGAEIGSAAALRYLAGFAAAAALLHVAGIAAGTVLARSGRAGATRGAGGIVALVGVALALGG